MPSEHVVAKTTDLKDGEMKELQAGDNVVLLARVDGEFYATGSQCPHYAAPLADGVLCDHQVRCPWHQACFDVRTGDLVEPPALSALPRFDVRVDGEDVIVTLPDKVKGRRLMPMAKHDPEADDRTFVIIGAGAAGIAAAEALRQDGFQGRIAMVTKERHLPYDRPDLTKDYLASTDHQYSPALRSETFYSNHGIEVMTEREVVRLDATAKTVAFADGTSLSYDKALLATGGRPRRLDVEGADLDNIFTLRSLDDADRIGATAEEASHAVVIGASFIGMETAASLTKRKLSVTVVAPESVPFERTLGAEIGEMLRKDHERNGVSFRLGRQAVRFSGDGKVNRVHLDDGERLEADMVIIGVGVRPVTDYVEGVELNPDGSLSVDERMQVAQDLYAAGDIARFPDWRTGRTVRIEHWQLAQQQGRVAGHNMAAKPAQYTSIPFFWSNQFKANVRYVGHATEWDEIIFDGDPADQRFVAYYVKDNIILAASACRANKKISAVAELMRTNRMPSVDELRAGSINLTQRLKT
jgi:NADPH-dependent 2,4-dienoyl-CoA reductase/sulfur reductase-like enzyme/nitrite reductase/ring-hydroxylating ferredoxin subunit